MKNIEINMLPMLITSLDAIFLWQEGGTAENTNILFDPRVVLEFGCPQPLSELILPLRGPKCPIIE